MKPHRQLTLDRHIFLGVPSIEGWDIINLERKKFVSISIVEGNVMDLLKELQELKERIQQSLADGRITVIEALEIAKELVDVLRIIIPLVVERKTQDDDKTGN